MHEVFTQNFWKNDALGRPILGTAETVASFDQGAVFDYYRGQFTPENMVFSAAGNLDHDAFVDRGRAAVPIAGSDGGAAGEAGRVRVDAHITLSASARWSRCRFVWESLRRGVNDAQRYGVYLLNTMLGWRDELAAVPDDREDEGLAYSIYSEMNPFAIPDRCACTPDLDRQDGAPVAAYVGRIAAVLSKRRSARRS